MASVSLQNIRKSYGKTEVLHSIDVQVDDGEFVVLVGPSGCGKSTLLRALAGLETINDGEIRIDDRVVNRLQPKQRDIAMVFQNYALYPHMTVAENMGFSLRLAKAANDEKERKVREAADILGLVPLLDRYPRQLSGGQRQRVAMGRAIVRNPSVFLFDEPLSNLDAKLRVQMRAEIKGLHQRLGTTVVYVTHDQVEAMTMADKIVVMRGGVIEQVGAPLALYDRPANLFVAGFIGSPAMNLLDASIEDNRILLSDGLVLGAAPEGTQSQDCLTVGIRPEHLLLTDKGLPARITLVEPTGAETQLLMDLAGHLVTMTTRDRVDARVGDSVSVSVMPDKYHYFDNSSGLSIHQAIIP